MANIMKDVARALGVEIDEEFKIEGLSFRYKIDEDGLIFWAEGCQKWPGSDLIGDLLTGKEKIIKLPKQILNEKEKEYLSNVIKPFRDRVNYIIKTENSLGEYITIHSRLILAGVLM